MGSVLTVQKIIFQGAHGTDNSVQANMCIRRHGGYPEDVSALEGFPLKLERGLDKSQLETMSEEGFVGGEVPSLLDNGWRPACSIPGCSAHGSYHLALEWMGSWVCFS